MEKHTQDKSSTDNKEVMGQDPARYEQGYGSFNESDFEKQSQKNTSGDEGKEETDKANITTGMNEDKSTISETSAPSKSISEKDA